MQKQLKSEWNCDIYIWIVRYSQQPNPRPAKGEYVDISLLAISFPHGSFRPSVREYINISIVQQYGPASARLVLVHFTGWMAQTAGEVYDKL